MADGFIEDVAPGLKGLLAFALSLYNKLAGMAVELLGQNPASWSGSGWNFVEKINAVFLAIAAVLVVIFFLIGFCSESLDIRQDFRLENLIRMFIKLSLAEFFVVNSLKIVKQSFAFATGVIGKLAGQKISFQYHIPEQLNEILENPADHDITGIGGSVMMVLLFIMALIFLITVVGCGMMVLNEGFQRFFKILMLVPYGTIANSTLAGNHTLNRSAESFWKYAFATILEAVTMYMALALSAAVMSGNAIKMTENETGAFYIIGWMLESSFICMVTVGIIKGAGSVTQRALGL